MTRRRVSAEYRHPTSGKARLRAVRAASRMPCLLGRSGPRLIAHQGDGVRGLSAPSGRQRPTGETLRPSTHPRSVLETDVQEFVAGIHTFGASPGLFRLDVSSTHCLKACVCRLQHGGFHETHSLFTTAGLAPVLAIAVFAVDSPGSPGPRRPSTRRCGYGPEDGQAHVPRRNREERARPSTPAS